MPTFNTVLLIDEDVTNNLIFKKLASSVKLSESLIICSNAMDGLAYLRESISELNPPPDAIFLDLNMPLMSGWDFLDAYENLKAQITTPCKIFILSTSSTKEDFDRAKNYKDVKQYLVKPISVRTLKDLAQKYGEKT